MTAGSRRDTTGVRLGRGGLAAGVLPGAAAIGLVMAAVLYEAAFGSRRGLFDRKRARVLTAVTLIAGFSRGRARRCWPSLDHRIWMMPRSSTRSV
jgi:hypothetical protein